MQMCTEARRGVRASGDGILSVVNHPTWVVGTKLKSSGRTGSGELSLAPAVVILQALIK